MLIYLEGPDGTGKTTLARELCARRPGAIYLHDTYRGRRQFIFTIALLRRAFKAILRGTPVVLDRSWIGDNIYSRVFRPGQQGNWVRWAHGLTERMAAVTVLAVPSERQRYLDDFEALKSHRPEKYDSMAAIYDAYAQVTFGLEPNEDVNDYVGLLSRTGGLGRLSSSYVYDRYAAAGENLVETADMLWKRAESRDRDNMVDVPSMTSHNWSGRIKTDGLLLVGERCSDPHGAWSVPFLRDDGGSRYLARALNLAGVRQDNLAMVNAYDANGGLSWDLKIALQRGRFHRVITLGEAALRVVRHLAPTLNNVHHITHPQWARRFEFHKINNYASKLKELCR